MSLILRAYDALINRLKSDKIEPSNQTMVRDDAPAVLTVAEVNADTINLAKCDCKQAVKETLRRWAGGRKEVDQLKTV